MNGPDARGGFTLIELLVVVIVLTLLTAMVIPVFGGASAAFRARSARGDFAATLIHAQELAVREGREIRLVLDVDEGRYWLEGWVSGTGEQKEFAPLPGEARAFPASARPGRVRARNAGAPGRYHITCYPNGASDQVRIELTDPERRGSTATISTTGALGGVRVDE